MKPLKWYKDLQTAQARAEYGCFLVEGPRAISQITAVHPGCIEEILIREDSALPFHFGGSVRQLSTRQLETIAPSRTPQGIVAVARMPQGVSDAVLPPTRGGLVLCCEHVQDPGNVGTLIRTAAGLGYEGVVLSRDCADPFSPKCVQASAGAICSLWIRRCGQYLGLLQQLGQQGYAILAADVHGTEQWPALPGGGVIVALGSEGQGLSQDLLAMARWRYRIPLDATRVESLNVAVAGAICMFQARSATA